MKNVEIEIYRIASTAPDEDEVRRWLDDLGASGYSVPDAATPGDEVVGLAAKRCYNSFEVGLNPNITRVRSDWSEFLGNVIASGHGSVLEHASHSFAIEGVTRVFTAEMNRHRAGVAVSEQSLRYVRYSDIPWWLPPSLRAAEGDAELERKKAMTRAVFEDVFEYVETQYGRLVDLWELDSRAFVGKKAITSLIRRIVPMGVSTGGVWTLNLRALRHVLTLRTTPEAEEEIAHVWTRIGKMMVETLEPTVFADFKYEYGCWTPRNWKI